jgi:hypothetical protein
MRNRLGAVELILSHYHRQENIFERQTVQFWKYDIQEAAYRITDYNQATPWSRNLIEKLLVAQLLKDLPSYYGTQCSIP